MRQQDSIHYLRHDKQVYKIWCKLCTYTVSITYVFHMYAACTFVVYLICTICCRYHCVPHCCCGLEVICQVVEFVPSKCVFQVCLPFQWYTSHLHLHSKHEVMWDLSHSVYSIIFYLSDYTTILCHIPDNISLSSNKHDYLFLDITPFTSYIFYYCFILFDIINCNIVKLFCCRVKCGELGNCKWMEAFTIMYSSSALHDFCIAFCTTGSTLSHLYIICHCI